MMSGNDCWNKNVFSRWRKVPIEGDDWTWTGKVFQTVAAALYQFPSNFHVLYVDGEVANLLRTCYGETGVMDFAI